MLGLPESRRRAIRSPAVDMEPALQRSGLESWTALMATRVQLIVTYADHQVMYYPVDDGGWRIDSASRCLVVGKGVPRTLIPLDRVVSFDIADLSS